MALNNDVPTFLAAVASTHEVWASLDVRTIALRLDGTWHNLMTRCVLDARSPDAVPNAKLPADTKFLACRQEVFPATMLPDLVDSVLQKKEVVIGGLKVIFTAKGYNNAPEDAYRDGYV